MAQKPVDQLRTDERREAVWAAIRTMKDFTLADVCAKTRLHKVSVRDYIIGLAAAGYIAHTSNRRQPGTGGNPAKVYTLTHDIGVEAPRVRKDGTPVTQGAGREQMWRTMRILGTFTAKELAVTASTETRGVALSEARAYIHYLHKAGYIFCAFRGKWTVYRFNPRMYTGPKPPQVQRVKQVFDPNTGRVVWPKGGDHDQ